MLFGSTIKQCTPVKFLYIFQIMKDVRVVYCLAMKHGCDCVGAMRKIFFFKQIRLQRGN